MLSRADYGDLWEGPGYPPRPALAALSGSVVHRCLELLLTTFQAHGCKSVNDPSAVAVIRGFGGYSKLVDSVITEELAALEGNPRATDLKTTLELQLVKEVPHMRKRVQLAISRAQLVADPQDSGIRLGTAKRASITPGSHAEVDLRADELRLLGRADLITVSETGCTITDYKTGVPSDHHAEQLRLYGLLWSRDREVNPDQIPIERLVVSYATHDVVIDPPSDAELETLADQIGDRIAATEEQFAHRPPPANPDPEICEFCDVRHLCDDYWMTVRSPLEDEPAVSSGGFVDCEGEVARRNGPRSWVLKLEGESNSALLRTPTERPGFAVGDYVRLLGVAAATVQEEDILQYVLTMTSFSESFQLDRA
jgi:RecB family exonuclease